MIRRLAELLRDLVPTKLSRHEAYMQLAKPKPLRNTAHDSTISTSGETPIKCRN